MWDEQRDFWLLETWTRHLLSNHNTRPKYGLQVYPRFKTLKNVKLLHGLTSDETKTSEGLIIFYFGKWWCNLKTKIILENVIGAGELSAIKGIEKKNNFLRHCKLGSGDKLLFVRKFHFGIVARATSCLPDNKNNETFSSDISLVVSFSLSTFGLAFRCHGISTFCSIPVWKRDFGTSYTDFLL